MKKDKKEQEKENTTKLNQETEELQDSPEESSEDLMNKDKRIEELENEAADLKDKLLRKAAEFENYKRRTENDQFNLFKYAAESFIVKLLPIVDDFERSLQHIDNTEDGESIKEGLKLIYDKLIRYLMNRELQRLNR